MKNLKTISVLITALILFSSCDKEHISRNENAETPFSKITSLQLNVQMNELIVKNYGSSSNGRVTNSFGELLVQNAEIGYSSSSSKIAIVVPFEDGITSLLILGEPDGTIYEEFITSIQINPDNSSDIKYYDLEGNPTIYFSIKEGKVVDLVSNDPSGRIATWDSCATCAVTSCGADGGCTILCGLTGPWCLSAIALACIGSNLSC